MVESDAYYEASESADPSISPLETQAREYMEQHVDPVLTKALTEIHLHKPHDACQALLNFFQERQESATGTAVVKHGRGKHYAEPAAAYDGVRVTDDAPAPKWLAELPTVASKERNQGINRWYAVHHVLPILARLLRHLAVQQPSPDDGKLDACVVAFLIRHRQEQKAQVEEEIQVQQDESRQEQHLLTAVTSSATVATAHPPSPSPSPLIHVLVLGLEGSGKSTILAALQGDLSPSPPPSLSSSNSATPTLVTLERRRLPDDYTTRLGFFDVPGSRIAQHQLWPSLYAQAQALVWVGDATQASRWEEEKAVLRACLGHEEVKGKPVWMLVNKQDTGLPHHSLGRVEEEVGSIMKEAGHVVLRVDGCIADAKSNFGVLDPALEEGLAWLIAAIGCERGERGQCEREGGE
ncbi:adp-ribosylation factor-like protein 13a [Nannochloropsis oceanica]